MYAVIIHAHQKLDRVAHRLLRQLTDDANFPSLTAILHFEGQRGPDATKLKNKTSVEQPWHFINPDDPDDQQLLDVVEGHFANLVDALQQSNQSRSAFEAAWLAHALVDGLTPAHHYPYEAELENLRGVDRHSRSGLIGRSYIKGETTQDSVKKSLKLVGPKGLLTTHTLFEAGAYSIMLPLRLQNALPTAETLADIQNRGLRAFYHDQIQQVAEFKMYDSFYRAGWTPALARLVRRELAPRMAGVIAAVWYEASRQAGIVK